MRPVDCRQLLLYDSVLFGLDLFEHSQVMN